MKATILTLYVVGLVFAGLTVIESQAPGWTPLGLFGKFDLPIQEPNK